MNHPLRQLAGAAALLCAAGSAQALVHFTGPNAATATTPGLPTTGSSLAFVAIDNTGAPVSTFIDLGFFLSDFHVRTTDSSAFGITPAPANPGDPAADPPIAATPEVLPVPAGRLTAAGTTVVWDFANNTVSVNGANQAGDYRWSAEYAKFAAVAQAPETLYGVLALQSGGYYLTSGNPTAANLTSQTSANTNSLGLVNALFNNQSSKGSFGVVNSTTDTWVGANTVSTATDAASGFVGSSGNLGAATTGNWQNRLAWNALVAQGTSSNFYQLRNANSTEVQVPGQFSYASGLLTWQVAAATPVPEGHAVLLAVLGVGMLAVTRRRRAGV